MAVVMFLIAAIGEALIDDQMAYLPAILGAALLGRGLGAFAAVAATLRAMSVKNENGFLMISPDEAFSALILLIVTLSMALGVSALAEANDDVKRERDRAFRREIEMDILFTDLGHRVKNDLARLASVMRLHAKTAPEATKTALLEASRQTAIVARIHDRLSRRDGDLFIRIDEILGGLIEDMRSCLSGQVALVLESGAYELSAGRANAVAMVANELITNALKHAFPNDREGTIRVAFQQDGNTFVLTVEDDGAGIVEGRCGSGQKIIRSMSSQLGGEIAVGNRPDGSGVRACLRFPVTDQLPPR